jgi:short-subunit dehydrogenase
MRQLRGRRGFLTGASGGIGPHIAQALAREGVDLALTARSVPALERVATSVRALGVRVTVVPADLARADEREVLVAKVERTFGPIDVLVNNAGVESEGAFLDLPPATIAETVEVNLLAPMHLARLLVPGMVTRGVGHVVNISSLAGKKAVPYDAVYGATKAGLVEWTSALRMELAGTGVGLSVVCPGYVTDEGMFARFGMRPLWTVGSSTPSRVAGATVRAIRRNRAEVIVNSMPARPALAMYALFPGMADRLLRALGVVEFQRRKLESQTSGGKTRGR